MVLLVVSCTGDSSGDSGSFSQIAPPELESTVPSSAGIADRDPLLQPTTTLTPTWLLSIDKPTYTVSESLATTMIATHVYSTQLLYYPNPFGDVVEGWFTETVIAPEENWRSNYVTNTGGTYRAFTVCGLDSCQERILIENLDTEQIYEFGFSARMNWRPISHLRWLDDNTLLFDQWSQPHYGFEFAVDVQDQRLVLYVLITDECFVYGRCN